MGIFQNLKNIKVAEKRAAELRQTVLDSFDVNYSRRIHSESLPDQALLVFLITTDVNLYTQTMRSLRDRLSHVLKSYERFSYEDEALSIVSEDYKIMFYVEKNSYEGYGKLFLRDDVEYKRPLGRMGTEELYREFMFRYKADDSAKNRISQRMGWSYYKDKYPNHADRFYAITNDEKTRMIRKALGERDNSAAWQALKYRAIWGGWYMLLPDGYIFRFSRYDHRYEMLEKGIYEKEGFEYPFSVEKFDRGVLFYKKDYSIMAAMLYSMLLDAHGQFAYKIRELWRDDQSWITIRDYAMELDFYHNAEILSTIK